MYYKLWHDTELDLKGVISQQETEATPHFQNLSSAGFIHHQVEGS